MQSQSGTLTVTERGSTSILLLGRPRRVEVHFEDVDPVPCNPHHHGDRLSYGIEVVDEEPRHRHDPERQHHERQFYLYISWEVSGVREIAWFVIY